MRLELEASVPFVAWDTVQLIGEESDADADGGETGIDQAASPAVRETPDGNDDDGQSLAGLATDLRKYRARGTPTGEALFYVNACGASEDAVPPQMARLLALSHDRFVEVMVCRRERASVMLCLCDVGVMCLCDLPL